jgi:hypothetical protein
MNRFVSAVFLVCTSAVFAQTSALAPSSTVEITVKSSPAEIALLNAASDFNTNQKSMDTILQQAKTIVAANAKVLQDELTATQKELNDKVMVNKKYKPLIDKIANLNKELTDLSQNARTKYFQDTYPIQQKMKQDDALITGLVHVVKQENNLPNTATFDPKTQKWTVKK